MYLHNCILKRKVNLLRVCVHLVYCGETYFRLTSTKRKRNALSEMEKWREKGHQTKNKLFAYFFVNFRETREFQPNKLKRVTLKFSFLCIYIVSYFYNLNSNLLIEGIIKKNVFGQV